MTSVGQLSAESITHTGLAFVEHPYTHRLLSRRGLRLLQSRYSTTKSTRSTTMGFLQAALGFDEFFTGTRHSSPSCTSLPLIPLSTHAKQWVGKTSTRSSMISSCLESSCLIFPSERSRISNIRVFYSLVAARAPRTISERRITHIVSVCTDPIPADVPAGGIRQLRIPVEDKDHADILIYFTAACNFIHQAIAEGGTVLVHCEQGLTRSATIVAAYVSHSDHSSGHQVLMKSALYP